MQGKNKEKKIEIEYGLVLGNFLVEKEIEESK
jgi:hypothetical protein